ncbi:MAG: ribosomal protein L7/L12 [Acidovorax sp.]|uniref:ribosomal protein L7/L12 n=1 Tax=Acidovorax sp. TaxID=1872122 RepID=UPI0039191270
MFKPGDPLPPAVLASLAQGRTIDAIKQLREAHGLSLKEAKDIVDAHARPAAASHSASHSAMPRPTGFTASTAMGSVPDTVQHALAQGNKIEAIRLLREHAGIGLKEAKDRVDALDVSRQRHADGLAPGEMSRKTGALTWVAVAAIVVLSAYAYLRSGA